MRTAVDVEHLMASAAIPFVFPAARLLTEGRPGYHGDGSMRQLTPLAPVIQLGAERVLAIGVGHAHEPAEDSQLRDPGYPSLAQLASHVLASIFLDTLARNAQRLHRVNHRLSMMTPQARAASRPARAAPRSRPTCCSRPATRAS